MAGNERVRLDELIVRRGMAGDRRVAQALILSGRVRAPGLKNVKAGERVLIDQVLELGEEMPFVSRGGLKLQEALREFSLDVRDAWCVDIGASTGGFTDCLLKAGAARVLAIDVGHGQLDWKLRNDPRVVNWEKTHILRVTREDINKFIGEKLPSPGLVRVVVDVSFISLEKVIPHLADIFDGGTEMVLLVKPQFEVEAKEAPKGVVTDPEVHRRVVGHLQKFCEEQGFLFLNKCESPLTGPEGNREFLFHLKRG